MRTGQNLLVDFSDEVKDPLTLSESRRMVRAIVEFWKSGNYSKVSIVYNHYFSAISQIPTIKTLFPVDKEEIFDFLERFA